MKFSSGRDKRESFEDIRREYLAARTRGARAFIAGLPLVPALFATGFGVVAVFKFGEDFVGLFGAEGSKGNVLFLVLAGVFGLGIVAFFLRFAILAVRVLHLVFTAPPCGSVPAEATEDAPDAAAAPNPFRGEKNAEEAERAAENPPLAAKILFSAFGAIFCVIGICFIVSGVKTYLAENAAAETWVSAPCRIVSSKLKRHTSKKEGTTYSPEIVFEFSVGGKTFRGDKIFFTSDVSSNDHSAEAARLERFRKLKTCWHDPENPHECSLKRPEGGFAVRKMTTLLFGAAFAIFGAGFAALPHVGGRSRKRKPRERSRALGELDPASSSSGVFAMIVFAVMWNTLISVFLVFAFSRFEETGFSVVHFFLIPFVLVGIGLAVAALRATVGSFNPRYALTLAPSGPLPRGGNALVSWRVVRGDSAKMRSLKISLVLLEPSGAVVNGKPKMKVEEEIVVAETRSRAGLRSGEASFAVPADLRAAGKWALRLSGKTTRGFFRPNLEADFPVSV
ncbi:MAG: DUF3592 domain-containing protein [Candidatus Spyradosoma sp.]